MNGELKELSEGEEVFIDGNMVNSVIHRGIGNIIKRIIRIK